MAKSVDKNLKKLPLGAIRPTGWLKDEMLHMCDLQKKLGALQGLIKNGEWTQGESLPRYARGLTLLAAALDDKNLKERMTGFFQPIFNSANEGGDIGPKDVRTQTPKIEAIKAVLSYYEYTGSDRALAFLKKYFKNQFNTYDVMPCWYDSRARLLEEIPALEALYRETDLEWLQDLGEKLRDSSNDWFRLADKFTYKRPTHRYISMKAIKRMQKTVAVYERPELPPKVKPLTPELVEKLWKKQIKIVETDGVNIAKAVKYPAMYGRFVGDDTLRDLSVKMVDALMRNHGTAAGMFTSDCHLAGSSPVRGIDVQASVEMIESLVEVIKETADYHLADLLERIAFNVISGACFEDCGAVQDLLLVNQIEASENRNMSHSEIDFSNAFYTRKLSRGAVSVLSAYPLYMQAACMVKDNELNFLTYTPCDMDVTVGGIKMTISERTGYPFRNTVVFKVEHANGEPEVKINFRVPKNVTMQLISGGQVVATGSTEISVKCVLRTGSTFMLKMNIPLTVEENADGTYSLFKGNLLMSLKVPHEIKQDIKDRRTLCLNFAKKWNIAPLLARRLRGGMRELYEDEITVVHDMTSVPFSGEKPPFELRVRSKNVINWDYDVNGFTETPSRPVYSEEALVRVFVPFGCSLLRIAEFPKCLR